VQLGEHVDGQLRRLREALLVLRLRRCHALGQPTARRPR
jgi:hypothetical protein